MEIKKNEKQKRFYLVTVDILQGISVFFMVMGHTGIWWDSELDTQWPNVPFFFWALITIALVVPPGFLFWYAFNTTNSLLRRHEKTERLHSRSRLLKRTIIFFLIAEFGELVASLAVSPRHWLNYLLTWELFHMFAFSTFFLLIIFELAWMIESRSTRNHKEVILVALSLCLIFVISFFLIFHDYSSSQIMPLYVDLNINSILQRIFFEQGQSPIIPWLAFPASGSLLASYLDLPNEDKDFIIRRALFALIGGFLVLLVGISFMRIERYVSTAVWYPASSPLVFIAIGIHILTTTGFILFLDLNTFYEHHEVNRLLLPVVLLSKITLTVYIVHNIAFAIPSEDPFVRTILPNVDIVLFAGFLYSLLFVIIAFIWQRRDYKYSVEWFLSRLQRAKWQWWVDRPSKH
ncbi:MAG: acyltransferase family protein [Candidatus Hodarchaeota archaeon]